MYWRQVEVAFKHEKPAETSQLLVSLQMSVIVSGSHQRSKVYCVMWWQLGWKCSPICPSAMSGDTVLFPILLAKMTRNSWFLHHYRCLQCDVWCHCWAQRSSLGEGWSEVSVLCWEKLHFTVCLNCAALQSIAKQLTQCVSAELRSRSADTFL